MHELGWPIISAKITLSALLMNYSKLTAILLALVFAGCEANVKFDPSGVESADWESELRELSGRPKRLEPRKLKQLVEDDWEDMRQRSMGMHAKRFELSSLNRTKESLYCALILTNKDTGKERLLFAHDAPWTDPDLENTQPKIYVALYPNSIEHNLMDAEEWVVTMATDLADSNPSASRITIPNLASFSKGRKTIDYSGGPSTVSNEKATNIVETEKYQISLLHIVYAITPSKPTE